MGIKLNLEVETPLSDDDRDILAGISVKVLAIANRQNLADQPHMQQEDEEDPRPCGSQSDEEPTFFGVSEVGHEGRHKYRPVDFDGLVNYALLGPVAHQTTGLTPPTSVKLPAPVTVGASRAVNRYGGDGADGWSAGGGLTCIGGCR